MTAWSTVSARAGRNDLPALLAEHWTDLSDEDLRHALRQAWVGAEWPEQMIEAEGWGHLFGLALDEGLYLLDEALESLHTLPEIVTLWRGATEERRNGMSWTSDRSTAEWFAKRFRGIRDEVPTFVYRIEIPRDLVLARFTGRGEHEYVVEGYDLHDDEFTVEQ